MCHFKRQHHCSSSTTEKGYILLFTLGVLSVLAVLSLSVATAVRLEAQSLGDEKIRLQHRYALQGAAHYGLATLNAGESNKEKNSGQFKAEPQGKNSSTNDLTFHVELNGFELLGETQDASLLPDGNLLTSEEWKRLAIVLGASPEEAQQVAKIVLQDKLAIETATGKGGFRSINELVGGSTLPLPLIRGALNSQGITLTDLIVIGTELKQIDANESPLVMFKILTDFTDAQLARLSALRARGKISDTEAGLLFAGSATPRRKQRSDFLTLKIKNETPMGSQALGLVMVIQKNNDKYKSIDSAYTHAAQLQ